MAAIESPFSAPRQMPVKVTTAPISVRPRVSAATSAAISMVSRCRRMVTTRPHVASPRRRERRSLSPRHGREEGDFLCAGNCRVGPHVALIDRGADHPGIFERVGVFLAALREPPDEIADRRDARRRLDLLLRLADALAHPGKVADLHVYSSITCRSPARK